MEHQAGEGQARQHRGQPLVVTRQAAAAGGPREAAFHDLARRQEHEAALGLRQLDHFEPDPVVSGRGGRRVAGVALIDERSFPLRVAGVALIDERSFPPARR